MTNWNNVIGKTMDETKDLDWASRYPEITEQGVIVAIHDADALPDGAVLVDWHNGQATVPDGANGFDAILSR